MMCGYYTGDPRLPEEKVVLGCTNEVGEGPLLFFVPVGSVDAVRVPVCKEHCAILEALYDPQPEGTR